MWGIDGGIVAAVVVLITLSQAALALAWVFIVWPWLSRLQSELVKIAEWWLLALLSTTSVPVIGWITALLANDPAVWQVAGVLMLGYVAQLPFGVLGTVAWVIRNGQARERERQARVSAIGERA